MEKLVNQKVGDQSQVRKIMYKLLCFRPYCCMPTLLECKKEVDIVQGSTLVQSHA